jgi:hypothetical protein
MSHHGHSHGGGCGHAHDGPSPSEPAPGSSESNGAFAAVLGLAPAHVSLRPEYSLPLEFSRGEQLYRHIEEGFGAGAGPEGFVCESHSVPDHVSDALHAFLRCAEMVRRDGVFSKDEIVEDINTEDLRYVLIEYYLASLQSRSTGPTTPAVRARTLVEAKAGYEAFLERVVALGIISASEGLTLGVGTGAGGAPRIGGGNDLRSAKIERFKRTQAAKKRLAELSELHRKQAEELRKTGAVMDGVGSAASAGPDEETQREMSLLAISIAARTAADEVLAINQELPLLQHALKLAEKEDSEASARGGAPGAGGRNGRGEVSGGGRAGAGAGAGPGIGGMGNEEGAGPQGPPANDMSVRPDRPGIQVTHIDPTFTLKKETVKAGIFQFGHK